MYEKSFINIKFMVHERLFSNQNIYINHEKLLLYITYESNYYYYESDKYPDNIHIITAFNVNLMLITKYTRLKNNIGQ